MAYQLVNKIGQAKIGFQSDVEYSTTSTMQRHIVQASDGTLAAIIQRGNMGLPAGERGLLFLRSTDKGATWTRESQLVSSNLFTADMEIDADNNIYASYTRNTNSVGTGYDVAFRKFTYDGVTKTWAMGAQVIVFDAGATTAGAWSNIAREPVSGRLWVAFRFLDSGTGIYTLKLYYSDNDGTVWADTGLSIGHNNAELKRYGLILSSNTKVFVIFHDTDALGQEWKRCAIHNVGDAPGAWSVGDIAPTIAVGYGTHYAGLVDDAGNVHVVYEDKDGADTDVWYTKYEAGAWSAPFKVGIGGGMYPSLCLVDDNSIVGFANTDAGRKISSKTYDIGAGDFQRLVPLACETTAFSGVYLYAGGVTQNLTAAATGNETGDIFHTVTGGMVKDGGDYITVRGLSKFNYVFWKLSQAGVGGTIAWEYWDGVNYAALTLTNSLNPDFQGDGCVDFAPPTEWAQKEGFYEVRGRATVGYSTVPIGDRVGPMKYRRRLAIPAKVDLALSDNKIPSIIREGEVDGALWNIDRILWTLRKVETRRWRYEFKLPKRRKAFMRRPSERTFA